MRFLLCLGTTILLLLSACNQNPSGETENNEDPPPATDSAAGVGNYSFEEGKACPGWSNCNVGSYEYFAPVHGTHYATRAGGAVPTFQQTGHTIAEGETVTVTLWARSAYDEEHMECLRNCEPQNYPPGNSATATAKVRLHYGEADGSSEDAPVVASSEREVNPEALKGAPQRVPNDDGGNVVLDGDYRMEFADEVFYQPRSAHPIHDPWKRADDSDYAPDMAVGPVVTPDGFRALYSTYYDTQGVPESLIEYIPFSGSPPDYDWGERQGVLAHEGDEDPWTIDAHLEYDEETGRLWMSWGGVPMYVSELDPTEGTLVGDPSSLEFDDHPEDAHTPLANWSGDEWTADNEWAEGPSLFKRGEYWYFFASYGHLSFNYTIRMGRGKSPTGPFYDKEGTKLTEWDEEDQEYGNSFLLGDDSDHLVPGHPHLWEEEGRVYMGYDYRTGKAEEGDDGPKYVDTFGIRRIRWVNGWPTIWTPITVRFDAAEHPDAVGKKLGVSFQNVGEAASIIAVDFVELRTGR